MISTAETCKGKAAASLSVHTIVALMEQIRPEIERFYHWTTGSTNSLDHEVREYYIECRYRCPYEAFNLMMAVDSAFLLHFLISLYKSSHEASSSLELGPLQECIKSDILKLENQIPLFVMKKVFENTKEASIYAGLPEDFNQLLQETCPELSPFEFKVSDGNNPKEAVKDPVSDGNNPNEAVEDQQPHLLAYMHAFVSPTLQIQEMENPELWQRIKYHILDIPIYLFGIFVIFKTFFFERKYEIALHAEKLAKAGIKFKLLSRATEQIGLDSWSGTLYLPRINICEMQTEVLLRNMVALEFNDVARGTTVMRYIGLMDSLIQTPDDVRVLRDHHVITTDTVTDESIAKMWNDLARPFFTGQFKLAPRSDDLGRGLFFVLWQQKLKSKLIRMLWGLCDLVYSWKFIGLVAATLGLFMTAVQTYFTVYPRKN